MNLIKSSRNVLKLIVINLAIAGCLIEGISVGFYWLRHQQFFYTRTAAKPVDPTSPATATTPTDESTVFSLHPFLGYVYKPGTQFQGLDLKNQKFANNYGFPAAKPYPFVKTKPNQYIIGIFGGSVAAQFSMYEQEDQIIAQTLKKIPEFADKEIIILSFAAGGYKQPQQLLLLNYFLALGQEFDLVINIDGFNEVVLAEINHQRNIDVAMPSSQHLMPLVSLANNSFSTENLEKILAIQTYQRRLTDNLNFQENCWLASCYVWGIFRNQHLNNRYQQAVRDFDRDRTVSTDTSDSIFYLNQPQTRLDNTQVFEQMTNLWMNASLSMKNVLAAQNIPYFHVLQPNQYYQTQRQFTSEERNQAITPNHPYSQGVIQGYPQLLKKAEILQENQVNFINAVTALDREKSTVYSDDCCHYNALGQQQFAQFVADEIVKILQQTPPKINPAPQEPDL